MIFLQLEHGCGDKALCGSLRAKEYNHVSCDWDHEELDALTNVNLKNSGFVRGRQLLHSDHPRYSSA